MPSPTSGIPADVVALLASAREHLAHGVPLLALTSAYKALLASEQNDSLEHECIARITLAKALSQAGDLLSAIVHFQRAYVVAKQLRDAALRSDILEGLGHCFLALEGYKDAQKSFRGAIAAAELCGDSERKAIAAGELVRTLCRYSERLAAQQQFTQSKRLSAQALVISNRYVSEVTHVRLSARAKGLHQANRSYALMQNGLFEEAAHELRLMRRSKMMHTDKRYRAIVASLTAQLALRQGLHDEAIVLFRALIVELEQSGHRDILLYAQEALANALEQAGHITEALVELRSQVMLLRTVGRDVLANRGRFAKMQEELREQRKLAQRFHAAAAQWEQKAQTDALTKLNTRYLLDTRNDTVHAKRAANYAVIMIDLDHFKHINDQYGHPVGDKVLARAAKQVRSVIDEMDLSQLATAYRYGGEEFVIVTEAISRSQCKTLAKMLHDRIKALTWQRVAKGLRVTASVGVAYSKLPLKGALQAADMALYQAKKNGRDCVVHAKSSSEPK